MKSYIENYFKTWRYLMGNEKDLNCPIRGHQDGYYI